jgi:hypothetical protein
MNEPVRAIPLRPLLARICVDYNPFYLLSAMCMLAGLFALNNSLTWIPLPEHKLLYLIFILNIYEAMLIGLGIYLASRGLMRDASTLFILEAFFLVDAGFLNSEIFTADFTLGLGVNIALFVLAFIKLAAVFHGLGLSIADGRFALILSQMLILLALPGVLKQASEWHDADLPPAALFGVWWVVGLIPVLYVLLLRDDEQYAHRGIVGTFMGLALVSILAHLCTSNWVYHARWYSANLSPLLLGLAIAIGASDRHVRNLTARLWIQLVLPVLAILLASEYLPKLNFAVSGIPITPLRLVLFGAAAVYLHGLLVHRHPYFAIAGLCCVSAGGFGETPENIGRNVASISQSTAKGAWSLIPTTRDAWGIVSVAASFVLLALGMVISLIKPAPTNDQEESILLSAGDVERPDP